MSRSRAGAAAARDLGLVACTALVVGNMIGSGIFLLPASLASLGPISLRGWFVTPLARMPVQVAIKWRNSRAGNEAAAARLQPREV